jgi:hypothetical protein
VTAQIAPATKVMFGVYATDPRPDTPEVFLCQRDTELDAVAAMQAMADHWPDKKLVIRDRVAYAL